MTDIEMGEGFCWEEDLSGVNREDEGVLRKEEVLVSKMVVLSVEEREEVRVAEAMGAAAMEIVGI